MTDIPNPEGADQAIVDYFGLLRALDIGDDEGWFEYLAGDNRNGRYIVKLADTGRPGHARRRVLGRDAFWWILGAGDRHGHGNLILAPPEVPDLVTAEQAAEIVGLSKASIQDRVDDGRLYAAYPRGGGRKMLVLAEVLAQAANSPAAGNEWARLRDQWPPADKITDLDQPVDLEPEPRSSTPLADLRIQVLETAERAQLLRYLWVDPTTDTYAASITVDKVTTTRQLYGPHVLPWTRGVADQAGRPDILEGLV